MMILIRVALLSILLSTLLSLVGCNFLELVYYDRAKLSFIDKNKETRYVFLCKKGEDQTETNKRFDQARAFFEQQMSAIMEEYSTKIDSLIDAPDLKGEKLSVDIAQSLNKLSKQSEQLALQLEKNYQCLLLDSIDLDDEGLENEQIMSNKNQSMDDNSKDDSNE